MRKNFLFLPVSLPVFVFLIVLPFLLLAFMSLLEISPGQALAKILGLSLIQTVAVYLTVLLASFFNLPVYEFKSNRDSEEKSVSYLGSKYVLPIWHGHNTTISINMGGCVLALAVCAYVAFSLPLIPATLAVIAVSLGVYLASRPSRSMGYYAPFYLPPLLSIAISAIALYVNGMAMTDLARLSILSGVIGTLLGTTVFHIPKLRKIGTSFVSMGGVGSFDGIIATGILSTIVACVLLYFIE